MNYQHAATHSSCSVSKQNFMQCSKSDLTSVLLSCNIYPSNKHTISCLHHLIYLWIDKKNLETISKLSCILFALIFWNSLPPGTCKMPYKVHTDNVTALPSSIFTVSFKKNLILVRVSANSSILIASWDGSHPALAIYQSLCVLSHPPPLR